MTTQDPHADNQYGDGDPFDPSDWDEFEADVVDLDTARARRDAAVPDRTGTDETPRTDDAASTGTDANRNPDRIMVDRPNAQGVPPVDWASLDRAERRPIIPNWMRTRSDVKTTATWAAGHVGHASLYHLTRTPKYAGRVLVRAPRGAVRVVTGAVRWTFDLEGEPVRQATVRREDAEQYIKLSRQRDARVRLRVWIAGLALALFCAGSAAVAALTEGPLRWAAIALLITAFGLAGAPADRPLLDTAVVVPRVARLTSDVVERALSVLGLAGISQALARNPHAIGFPSPITRDGPGWRADIDLPYGVTAAEVIERRDKLAAGLSRPIGCVWPEGAHHISPGRLVLWVGDQDLAAVTPPPWPLIKAGLVDLFKPIPFGHDPRGRAVSIELPETNMLIGSIPGAGKTSALRIVLLAAALDPLVELWAFDLKGSGDLDPISRCSVRYGSGFDDETAEAALYALRDLRTECAKRAATIKNLPKSTCPDNKVTPELARRAKLGLHLLVVAIDEVQNLFTHAEYGKEAGVLAEQVIKLGRALGVILLLATQRPDAKSMPTGVSANVGTRFCLRVMGQLENDMILGTSAYRNGIRATLFTKRDRGVGYLIGAADEPQIVKAAKVDGPTADRIIDRARAAREAAGTLTGYAAGQGDQTPAVRRGAVLDDILTVVPVQETKVWTDVVVERLRTYKADQYADLTRDQLTALLRSYGVTPGQVWGTDPDTGQGVNRRGFTRADIAEIVTERNQKRGDQATG